MDELPPEAMHLLVKDFSKRTPHLSKAADELGMLAVEAIADGQTMTGPTASMIGEHVLETWKNGEKVK